MKELSYLQQRHQLNGLLVEKNTELHIALKQKQPLAVIECLQSQIQELYNQLEACKLCSVS